MSTFLELADLKSFRVLWLVHAAGEVGSVCQQLFVGQLLAALSLLWALFIITWNRGSHLFSGHVPLKFLNDEASRSPYQTGT